MSKNQGLRFAAGSSHHPRSSVWKLVSSTKKDDIYLGMRYSMRMMKLSLHESGIWRYALTQESGAAFKETNDRVGGRWVRPDPFIKGWTQGPSLVVPHAGTDDLLTELDEPGARSIVWVPGPAEGRMLHFTLLLADESVRPTSPLPISEGDIKVGRLDMPRGKSVWMFARDLPMAQEQSDWAAAFAADMRITYSRRRPEDVYSSVFGISSDSEGRPVIWEIVLGERNVRVDPDGDDEEPEQQGATGG